MTYPKVPPQSVYKPVDLPTVYKKNRQFLVGNINRLLKTPPKKRTHSQNLELLDFRKQLGVLDTDWAKNPANKDKPVASPADPYAAYRGLGITDVQIKYLVDTLGAMGYTNSQDINDKMGKYTTAWNNYTLKKDTYKNNWKNIYGTDLPEFSFENNPFAMAGAVGSGNFMGYNLTDLATKALNIDTSITAYAALGGVGGWESFKDLTYGKFQELQKMFNAPLPTQGEFAQMMAVPSSSNKYAGKTYGEWETTYEDFRKKRKGLYTGEETKTAYSQTDEGFAVTGLKSKQEY